MRNIESFALESEQLPKLAPSNVREFERLNDSLHRLITNNLNSYRLQKEFTENASHELQTPLAILRTKLDLLSQQPELTERQASLIQDLYQTCTRLARLNRNLLLLAKIDNDRSIKNERICLNVFVNEQLTYLQGIATGLRVDIQTVTTPIFINANHTLLESMFNNLIVNAVRHNCPNGVIHLRLDDRALTISNTSNEPALDASHIFDRFYRPRQDVAGNGLGLAIVKAVCDCHGWEIKYCHSNGEHCFIVTFCRQSPNK